MEVKECDLCASGGLVAFSSPTNYTLWPRAMDVDSSQHHDE
jgi:hypothetical protein